MKQIEEASEPRSSLVVDHWDDDRLNVIRDMVSGMSLESPIDICPACYRDRDQVVPILTREFSNRASGFSGYYFRDADTGERLKQADHSVKVAACLACHWSKVENK